MDLLRTLASPVRTLVEDLVYDEPAATRAHRRHHHAAYTNHDADDDIEAPTHGAAAAAAAPVATANEPSAAPPHAPPAPLHRPPPSYVVETPSAAITESDASASGACAHLPTRLSSGESVHASPGRLGGMAGRYEMPLSPRAGASARGLPCPVHDLDFDQRRPHPRSIDVCEHGRAPPPPPPPETRCLRASSPGYDSSVYSSDGEGTLSRSLSRSGSEVRSGSSSDEDGMSLSDESDGSVATCNSTDELQVAGDDLPRRRNIYTRPAAAAVPIVPPAPPKAAESNGFKSWPPAEVALWVERVGLPQYAGYFRENHIDGATLTLLEKADLVEMGVRSIGHRIALLRARDELVEGVRRFV